MKILQLCVFTQLWSDYHEVKSIDWKTGTDVFDITGNECKEYDLICAAPPCTQFTKASAHIWMEYPHHYIEIAKQCLNLCKLSKKYWFLENPPGRIEKFIPELTRYRNITWRDKKTNKEYVIYSNFLIMQQKIKRYGKEPIKRSVIEREKWIPQLIEDIEYSLNVHKIHSKI